MTGLSITRDDRTCRQEPGAFVPIIDRNKCEGKGPCIDACPFSVFEMGSISKQERASLSLVGKVKAFMHGGKQAFAVAADRCAACGLCVRICPEKAITLVRNEERNVT